MSQKLKIFPLLALGLFYSAIYGCTELGNFANQSIQGDTEQAPPPADPGSINDTNDGSGPPAPVGITDGGTGTPGAATGEGGAPAGGGVGGARYAQYNPSGGTYSPGSEGHVATGFYVLVTVKSPEGLAAAYDTTSFDGKHCLRENEELEIFPEQAPDDRRLKIFMEKSNDPSRSDSWIRVTANGKNFFSSNGCGQTKIRNAMLDFDPNVGNTTCQYAVRIWATYQRPGHLYRSDPPPQIPQIITCQDLGAQVGDLTTKIKKPAVANLTLVEYFPQMYRQANILPSGTQQVVDSE